MIKITQNKDDIKFKGHSLPDICASVSCIMYTTANALVKYKEGCIEFEDNTREDYVKIHINIHDDIIDMLVDNMFCMFQDLYEDGNENKIEINRS